MKELLEEFLHELHERSFMEILEIWLIIFLMELSNELLAKFMKTLLLEFLKKLLEKSLIELLKVSVNSHGKISGRIAGANPRKIPKRTSRGIP